MSRNGRSREKSPQKLKLLFSFAGGLPRTGYGGGHQIVRGFARACVAMGHEVRVVLGGSDEVGAAAEDAGVAYRTVGSSSDWRFAPTGVETIRIARAWRPDLICCFTAELALVAPACLALRIPVITYVADPQLYDVGISLGGYRNARKHLGQFFQRLGSRHAARITTISEHTAQQVCDIWQLPAAKVAAVGTGLHDAYLATSAKPLDRPPGAPLRVLSVGRLALAHKPLDLVARALVQSEVPWSHWTIIGTSSAADEAAFARTVAELGLQNRVRLEGYRAPPDVARALADHDLVLLPSRHESFFMTPYEAIACQRLVVTNDVAEVKRRLGHSDLLILARDQSANAYREALSAAWLRLEARAPRDVALAQEIRDTYSWHNITTRLLEVAAPASFRR